MTALERAIARPQPVRQFADVSPLHGLERGSVGPADVLAQSVAAVAPTAAATTVILLVAGVSGGATVLAVVAATVLALLVASTVNRFARRLAASGALYTYAARGLGPTAALAAGASLIVGYGAVAVFALLGGAHALTTLALRVWPEAPSSAVAAGALIGEAAALAFVLVRGIRLSARVALVVEIVSVALVVALMITLLVHSGGVDLAVLLPSAGVSPSALAAGAVLAFTAFVGFESSATLGVEARAPLRTIPRAIVGTVLVAGTLYVLAAAAQVAGFASLGRDLTASAAPVDELAAAFGMAGWAAGADLGIAASFLACAIASTTALSRVLFAMARDGVTPPVLGRTHPRFGTPIGAVAVAVPLIAVLPLILVTVGIRPWEAMQAVITVAGSGYIVAYVIVCVAAPVFLRRIGESTLGALLSAGTGAVALVGCLAVYLVAEWRTGNAGVWAALGAAVVVAAAVAWRRRPRAAPLDRLGRYDEPVAAQVLGGVGRGHG